jgi:hypothetical protein
MQVGYVYGGVKYFPTPLSGTAIIGCAVLPNSNAAMSIIFTFGMARLKLNPGGALSLHRSDNDAQVAISSSSVWPTGNIWRYLELKITIATGACTVRVDGFAVMTGTVPVAATITSVKYPDQSFNTVEYLIDDMYVCDTTNTHNNDFLGDVRVQLLLPSADGTYKDMVPSSGTIHSNLVKELTPNTTDFVGSAVPGTRDTYQFQDLSVNTANVFGVEVTNYSHKDATGSAGISNLARVNGTDYTSQPKGLSSSWTANIDTFELNPATGAPWAPADVNSAEFGIETS